MSHDTYENIIEKPWSVRTTTLSQLVNSVKEELGEKAVVDFDRDIATVAHCSCGYHKDLFTPVHKLKGEMIVCPECGATMQFDSFHTIRGDEPFLSKTLFEIGIPLLDICGGRVGITSRYYEFSGDEGEVFAGLYEETT